MLHKQGTGRKSLISQSWRCRDRIWGPPAEAEPNSHRTHRSLRVCTCACPQEAVFSKGWHLLDLHCWSLPPDCAPLGIGGLGPCCFLLCLCPQVLEKHLAPRRSLRSERMVYKMNVCLCVCVHVTEMGTQDGSYPVWNSTTKSVWEGFLGTRDTVYHGCGWHQWLTVASVAHGLATNRSDWLLCHRSRFSLMAPLPFLLGLSMVNNANFNSSLVFHHPG